MCPAVQQLCFVVCPCIRQCSNFLVELKSKKSPSPIAPSVTDPVVKWQNTPEYVADKEGYLPTHHPHSTPESCVSSLSGSKQWFHLRWINPTCVTLNLEEGPRIDAELQPWGPTWSFYFKINYYERRNSKLVFSILSLNELNPYWVRKNETVCELVKGTKKGNSSWQGKAPDR